MQILLNNKDFGIEYIKLERKKHLIEDELILSFNKEFRQSILNEVEDKGQITIIVQSRDNTSFCLYDTIFATNYIYLLEEHENINEIFLEVNMINRENVSVRRYNQFIVDIFYRWSQNLEIDWSVINNQDIKTSYLEACYLWNQQYFKIRNINEVCINGKSIKCEEDFYYYLGEFFFGKRGFLGCNLDSLDDFLIDIVKNNEITTTIIFKDSYNMINNTSEYFFNTVVHLLQKAQFKIEYF